MCADMHHVKLAIWKRQNNLLYLYGNRNRKSHITELKGSNYE